MNITEARDGFKLWQEKMSAYNHAIALIQFDGSTTAPKGTAENRGHTLSILSEECYKLSTSPELIETLEFLDANKGELDAVEQRKLFLALKDIRDMQKIPMEEYVAYQALLVEADDKWHTAKETDDFELFRPCLEKIFETQIRFAGYCAPDKKPYDYCLGLYEDGLTIEKCDEFFSLLKSRIVPLIKKIGEKPQLDDACLHSYFDELSQEKFSLELMKIMGIDMNHCGLGTTEHPFTTSFGSHKDIRITTNYDTENFASSMYSVIHEGGHALYDLNSSEEYAYTLLDGGVSMGIHESQSRFYENILGRSRDFVEYIFPKLCEIFPEQMKGYSADDVYRALNIVRPSLIRVEADEVTYCLHVMVRYELEKRLIGGEMSVAELPGEWNRLYAEYLGVEVPGDREGVLQDSHWSGGGIGYFPSYALGSAYGAHFLAKMKEEIDVDSCMARGDFAPINEWNREHIWKHGCLYKPGELLERVLGEEFDPKYYIEYLEDKYSKLYGIKGE